MAYLMTYICSRCTWPLKWRCDAVTPESPPWELLRYCENCKADQVFLRDIVHSDGFPDELARAQPPHYLYLMRSANGLYKIGISFDPIARHRSLATGPVAVALLWAHPIENVERVEKELHRHFQDKRIRGEWFELDTENVEYIRGVAHGEHK